MTNDLFVTDSLELISLIYQLSKRIGINASQFEQVIIRSYERAWDITEADYDKLPGGANYKNKTGQDTNVSKDGSKNG